MFTLCETSTCNWLGVSVLFWYTLKLWASEIFVHITWMLKYIPYWDFCILYLAFYWNCEETWVRKPASRGSMFQFCYLNTDIDDAWDYLGHQGYWCLEDTHMICGRPQGHLWASGTQGQHSAVYPLVICQAAEFHTKNGIQAWIVQPKFSFPCWRHPHVSKVSMLPLKTDSIYLKDYLERPEICNYSSIYSAILKCLVLF